VVESEEALYSQMVAVEDLFVQVGAGFLEVG
jgi:hypothetical protein